MKYLALLVAFASFSARAQTPPTCAAAIPDPVPRNAVRLSWTAPTTNTDGSAVKTPITFTIYESAAKVCQIVTAGAASITGLSVGAHTWTVTAKTADGESAQSMAASKTIVPAPPNPPTNLLVDPASLTAFTLVQSKDRIALVAVGTVAPGTSCDTAQSVNGLNVVPISSVSFAGTVRPVVVVAKCLGG